jgi:hypothetical protein
MLGHQAWPPQISAQVVSLRLQQQLKSILSPGSRRARFHLGTRGRSAMVYVPLTRVLSTLNAAWTGNLECDDIFRQGVSVLDPCSIERCSGLAGPAMGFVARSAFWLGLVYSAMPFDSGRPTALAPKGTATSPAASPSLASLASAAVSASRSDQEGWKSAVEAAAALCSPNCGRAPPTGFADSAADKDPAEPPRRVSRAKSGREGAVRPPNANHIRSPDGQT